MTEVVHAADLAGDETHVFSIDNPRRGWLLFPMTAGTGRSGAVNLQIGLKGADGNSIIYQGRGATQTIETMRFLNKGGYTVACRKSRNRIVSLRLSTRRQSSHSVLTYSIVMYPR